jgi:hypothetical protein
MLFEINYTRRVSRRTSTEHQLNKPAQLPAYQQDAKTKPLCSRAAASPDAPPAAHSNGDNGNAKRGFWRRMQ